MAALKMEKNFLGNLRKRLQELDGSSFSVGYFPQNGYHQEAKMTYANLFAIQSFGSTKANIPARPVLNLNFQMWNPLEKNTYLKRQLKRYLSGIYSNTPAIKWSGVLDNVAGNYVQTTRDSFGDTTRIKSNKPYTIARKGFNSPLIETGKLKAKLSYVNSFNGYVVTP